MVDTLIVVSLLTFFVLLLGAWIVVRRGWLGGFLVGLAGLSVLSVSAVLILVTVRLFSYDPLAEGMRVGTMNMVSQGPDSYRITLTQDRNLNRYDLVGDTWRANGRVLQVPAYLAFGPTREVFILRNVQGRFQDMEREFGADRDLPVTFTSHYEAMADDLLARVFSHWDQHTALLPVADEAIFHLELRASSLRLVAVNEPAEAALLAAP